MYQPSSTSSTSTNSSMGPATNHLTRYGSAPGSFLSSAVDSVLGSGTRPHHHLYFTESANEELPKERTESRGGHMAGFKSDGSGGGLMRQSSSPAGFFASHLNGSGSNGSNAAPTDNGFPGPRGLGSSNSKGGVTRLNSQLSFTRQDSILSHISEEDSESGADIGSNNGQVRKASSSYGNSSYGWGDDPSNAIFFSSSPSNKRGKNTNGDFIQCLNREESQLQFGLQQSALEMATMDNLMHIPEDSVPCKIRAKRGCATHPRSIAERERRTRISGKLKKLQDLVPNMDKQTSYADMLDLAVQHIKGLQSQVQELNSDLKNCTCGCNRPT